jgi:hypothetical protein
MHSSLCWWTAVGTKLDLRSDTGVDKQLQSTGKKVISTQEVLFLPFSGSSSSVLMAFVRGAQGQKLANEIKAVKYVECSALTQQVPLPHPHYTHQTTHHV